MALRIEPDEDAEKARLKGGGARPHPAGPAPQGLDRDLHLCRDPGPGDPCIVIAYGPLTDLGGKLAVGRKERRVQRDGDGWTLGIGAQGPVKRHPCRIQRIFGHVPPEPGVAAGLGPTKRAKWRLRRLVGITGQVFFERTGAGKLHPAEFLRCANPGHDTPAPHHVERRCFAAHGLSRVRMSRNSVLYTLAKGVLCCAVLRSVELRRADGGSFQWPYVDQGLVFAVPTGGPVDPRNASRTFEALLTKAGLPHYRFHDLRHAFATTLLELGEPSKKGNWASSARAKGNPQSLAGRGLQVVERRGIEPLTS